MSETRAQTSLREEQRDVTRERIMTALAELIAEVGVADLSVQGVADRAGVSHRTVYRHYPSRSELLNGLWDYLDEAVESEGEPTFPDSIETLRKAPARLFPFFDRFESLMRAVVVTAIDGQFVSRHQEGRTRVLRRTIDRAFPDLPAADRRRAVAVLRQMCSSQSWFHYRTMFGFDGAEAGEAAGWAVNSLLDDLERRQRAAARKERTKQDTKGQEG